MFLFSKWSNWQQIVTGTACVLVGSVGAASPVMVTGSGNPATDIKAVQGAVNAGGDVILRGQFSFDMPPTMTTGLAGYPLATIQVTRAVRIIGAMDDRGHRPSIVAGTIPFDVEAPGAAVTLQDLRFVNPKGDAILVYAAAGITISDCEVAGVTPIPNFGAAGIEINTSADGPPTVASPGHPGNIAGPIRVHDNQIDVAGGTAADNTVGIILWSVGVSGAEVDAHVSGNRITHFNEKGINIRRVIGQVAIEGNSLASDTVVGAASGYSGIFAANLGNYLIADNNVRILWSTGAGYGIDLLSKESVWPVTNAVVIDNHITMEALPGTIFGNKSAGIDIHGVARDNVVLNNTISGGAYAGVALYQLSGSVPSDNTLALNRFDNFAAAASDVVVGSSVTGTRVIGTGTVLDQGSGTLIVPTDP